MEDKDNGPDSIRLNETSAPAPDPEDAPDESFLGAPWWEVGAAAEDEPEVEVEIEVGEPAPGAPRMYRGVRYGESVPEAGPRTAQEPDRGDEPAGLAVPASMSEDRTAVSSAAGGDAQEPVPDPPWWEVGATPEAAAEDKPEPVPDLEVGEGRGEPALGASYMHRGVWYGESVPEAGSRTLQEPDRGDGPTDLSVPASMSEDGTAVSSAAGGSAQEPVPDPPWWEVGVTPGAAAEDKPESESVPEVEVGEGRGEPALGASYMHRGVWYGESVPEAGSRTLQEPDRGDGPTDLSVPASMSEDGTAVSSAEGGNAQEPVPDPPWWEVGATPEAAAEDKFDADADVVPEPESDSVAVAEPESVPESEVEEVGATTEDKPDADAEVVPEPDVVPEPESEIEPDAGEDRGEPAPEPPASQADVPAAAEALPEGPPADLIRSIVAEVCPGELLLVDTAEAPLPAWAHAAVTMARNDLDRRLAERRPIDVNEHLRLAIVENVMGLHEEAEGRLKEALPRSDRFGPFLNALAVTSLARGKIAPAIVYCKEALHETDGDDSLRAAASCNLGDACHLQGNAAQAAEAYETAIDCLGPEGESRRLSRLHLRIGRLYQSLGQTDKARPHLSDSVRLFRDSGDEAGQVQSLAALGSALTEAGLHDLALRNFEEGVRICLRTGDKPGAAVVQDGMGVAYMAQDQLTRALAYLESALAIYRELGNHKGEAAVLSNMGKIHYSRGDIDEAQQLCEAALAINREHGREARRPDLESDGQEGARARSPEVVQQENVRRMIEKLGPGTQGSG